MRPYIEGGVRGLFGTDEQAGATLSGVALPLSAEPVGTTFSAFGGAGVRVVFFKKVFAEAGISYGKLPGSAYGPAAEVGLGWVF
ncbi:MAG: hypothetical protein IPM98_14735 [Lewinellaceae bacterium]|nr:hypothetical protein [Lewinellaceae bacterium]